ncbi:two-component regulator propeller domain-containing protein [Tamlana sp. 2201CG12-4]|uniref:two-component regulator propeller domain-containing protein n=1 Tax=Tamlana sp. 2201CG12-4 TaxID=3112582 RepID=UPI002DBFA9FA|nr:two-component regulator propeller domain-containing protein [Tamlana sp. 2201CG12-4]MEC3907032.1 two-component regulator propeller domain-containing protein [Tamlana sp. 2201CG12-4]
MKLKSFMLIICLLTFFENSYCQVQDEYRFQYIDVSKGLSSNYVSKIVTDSLGLKWFATEDGINTYDGSNFKLFTPQERYFELENENIETLFYDKNSNKIWVGTKSGGLSVYNPVLDAFKNFNHVLNVSGRLSSIRVTGIVKDGEENIWVATWNNGLFVLSADGKLKETFVSNERIHDLLIDPFGNIWALSGNFLYKYSPTEKHLNKIPISVGEPMTLFFDKTERRILIGAALGVFAFSTENYSLSELTGSVKAHLKGVNAINIDKDNNIWVGSWTQGLYVLSNNQSSFKKIPLSPKYLNNSNYETVLDIHMDDTDVVWIATGYGGVVKVIPSNNFKYYANSLTNDIGLPDNNIQAVVKDKHNNLWCGTWGGGIGFSKDGKHFSKLPGINIKVECFLEIEDVMLVGTKKGLFVYNTKNPLKGVIRSSLPNKKIKSLYLDSNNSLWVGTQQNGLLLFNYTIDKVLKNGILYNSSSKYKVNSDRISVIDEDTKGRLWVGTYNGLYLYNAKDSTFTREDIKSKRKFPSVIILSMYSKEKDTLWVGVPGGMLKILNTGTGVELIKTYNKNSGLNNDYITSVTKDSQNNIWFSSVSDIAVLKRDTQTISVLDEYVDMPYSININAYYNDGGVLFLGTSIGLFSFNVTNIEPYRSSQNIVLTSLKINNEEVSVGDKINGNNVLQKSISYTNNLNLSYKESVISFDFVAVNFTDQSNLNYLYRVKEIKDDWIDNGSKNEISFTGLSPGTYILEIKSTRDKLNYGAIKKVQINISPPFWLSKTAYAVYFILVLGIVYLIIRVSANRTRLKANLELAKISEVKERELSEAKLKFFTNISHELRTPLTLIVSPLSEILTQPNLKGSLKEKLNYIDKNANRLLDLINQLLDFRKAEQGLLNLQVAPGNFVKFSEEIFLSFKGYADAKDIDYTFETSNSFIPLTYDREKMEIVLCNLLSNAFKFIPEKGKVKLSLDMDEKYCKINIEDNGKGISKENQDRIFNRFFQIKDVESTKLIGSGIGLSLSQKIVKLHSGEINVKSKPRKGTKFTTLIPLGKAHFSTEDFIPEFKNTEDISQYTGTGAQKSSFVYEEILKEEQQETLLIVDDNKDILSYLESLFKNDYTVLVAENGLVAKEIAEKKVPDLIVSDVMMPEMDGLELCKHLKSNIGTSHIPIILLTARTSIVYEVDGLNIGADDYIKKPFNTKIVQSRVVSLLENRKRIREHLKNKIRFDTSPGIEAVNFEEAFINKAFSIVEYHLDDQKFGVEILANKLNMSQSTLYRKIKALTGMSIAGFIRSVRLKKASEVLLTQDLNLSAVAYTVGFSDYKYFKKSFTNQFGISPKEYREKN